MKQRAFSLTEILVVVAILALAAALIMPSLMQAKAKAKATSCMSNLMQLSKASLLYSSDHSGAIATSQNETRGYWLAEIQPYLKVDEQLHCPTHHRRFPDLWPSMGYAVNECLKDESTSYATARAVFFAELTEVALIDSSGASPLRLTALFQPDSYQLPVTYETAATRSHYSVSRPFGSERHSGGGNYALLDGHGKWVKPASIRRPVGGLPCIPDKRASWLGSSDGLTFIPTGETE